MCKENDQKTKNWKSQFKTFSFVFSLIAILFSGFTCWDSKFNSETEVFIGKQVRLYIIKDGSIVYPCIMAPLSLVNYGGKAKVLLDSKMKIRTYSVLEQKNTMEFLSGREVDNIIYAEIIYQQPITPIAVMGKSMTTRQIIYAPTTKYHSKDFTEMSKLEFDLYVKYSGENWVTIGTFEINNINGIWQDLEKDSIYTAFMVEPIKIK